MTGAEIVIQKRAALKTALMELDDMSGDEAEAYILAEENRMRKILDQRALQIINEVSAIVQRQFEKEVLSILMEDL